MSKILSIKNLSLLILFMVIVAIAYPLSITGFRLYPIVFLFCFFILPVILYKKFLEDKNRWNEFVFLLFYLIWFIFYLMIFLFCRTSEHPKYVKIDNPNCTVVLYNSGAFFRSINKDFYIRYSLGRLIAISLYKETIPADEDEHIYDEKIWTPIEK